MKKLKGILTLVLVFAMMLSLMLPGASAAETDSGSFMRMFQVDAGRKYFTVDEICGMLDEMSANNYNYLELVIGNGGLRFLLDDMSVTVDGTTYSDSAVTSAVQSGNDTYDTSVSYSVSGTEEWSQAEMDTIISYAATKGIEIIPLFNMPGHANALVSAMSTLGVGSSSGSDLNVSSSSETDFALVLLQKYAAYFAGKGCSYFNFGADEYGSLSTKYAAFRSFFNQCSSVIKTQGMTPMAFNDCVNRTDISETTTSASSSSYQYSIVMVDCGRKYFSVANLKQLIDNAAGAGMYYVMLGIGNDGMRFLLDDMSITVNGTTYSSSAVSSAIHAGNEAYSNFTVDELTESDMNELISYAASKGVEIIPMIETPGHMDAILDAAESLTGKTCSYNSSARTIDVTNSTATAFTKAILQKYLDYFSSKGCTMFNMGCDEYANDIYTTGGMGFGNLTSTGKYSYFISYVNDIAAMVEASGMIPMAFNDGLYYNNNKSSGTLDTNIMVLYWSSGWSGYTVRSAANLAADGFKMINAHGDYYWVLGKSGWQCTASTASGFSTTAFQGSTVSNPVGAMFLIWCDYPQADSDTNVISDTASVISSFGATLPSTSPKAAAESSTFDTDVILCYWSSGTGYASVQDLSDAGFRLLNFNNSWYYVLGDYLYTIWANGQWGYADSKSGLQNHPVTEFVDGNTSVTPLGACLCFWCDYPGCCTYSSVQSKVYDLIDTMASSNPSYFDGHIHSYTLQSQTEATCTEPGSAVYLCEGCGNTYTVTSAALGHDYAAENQAGDTVYTCSRCGDTYTNELPRQTIVLQAGETSDAITLNGTQDIAYSGESGIADADISHVTTPGNQVSYSATASASMGVWETYYASNVIDGNTSTYYWSNAAQTAGAYVQVDLGAEVRFDAIQVSSVAHTDHAINANVQVSSDGSTWTTIGTHTGSTSQAISTVYTVPSDIDSFRYIRVLLTQSQTYWWKLAEIAWGSYDDGTFTRAAASGTTGSAPVEQTSITFTGKKAGTTYYVIDGTRYIVTVEGEVHTHSYTSAITTPATCETAGVITYTCEDCGDTYTETIPATGHTYVKTVTEATCTTDGSTSYTCSVCGSTYVTETVAAYGHSEVLTSDTATCTKAGVKTWTCSRCGETRTETSPALGHNYTVTSTDATCTKAGSAVYTCSRCGDTYTVETSMLPHSYKTTVTAPTCTKAGYTTYTCSVCGSSYVGDSTAALGHNYTTVTKAATCTESGYTTYTCTRCGDTYTGNLTAALGHDYTDTVTEPTCTEGGYTTHTCSRCGTTYTSNVTAALGHDYTDTVTEPTCTENGYTTSICSRCGNTTISSTIAALGHNYAYTTVEATCTEGGYTTYTCSRCGITGRMNETAALGHDYVAEEGTDETVYTCSRCGESYSVPSMPTVTVALNQGETYSFTASVAEPATAADSSVASTSVQALTSGLVQADTITDGRYVLTNAGYRLTATASTYYSSWDSVGTVNGLAMGSFSTSGSYGSDMFTITAVSGGYTIQSQDGLYLNITESTKSTHLTLSAVPQVLTITDLGTTFAISSGSTYLDRYSSAFAGSYPGSINSNEQWTLYTAQDDGYQYTITGTGEGTTVMIVDGTRYEITVHTHAYTAVVAQDASCTTDGLRVYTCSCGSSYNETIPALGHNYTAEEGTDETVYTCSRCGDTYSVPVSHTTYDQVSTIASGNSYVITLYSGGSYYALVHNGTSLAVQSVTVSNGQITSDVTDSMLWSYNGKLYFTSGSTNYYLYRSSRMGSSSLSLSTSGSSVTYSSSRLKISSYYVRYSNGTISTSRSSYSTCYMFQENNG